MLRISKIYLMLFLLAVLVSSVPGCRNIPAGEAPARIVEIHPQMPQNGEMTADEAVNFVATELAVNVLSGVKGSIKLLIRSNPASNVLIRRVFNELKMFLPVTSVLSAGDFVLDSSLQDEKNKKIWHIRLKRKDGKIIWYECVVLKNSR